MTSLCLVSDVGGTNTRVGLAEDGIVRTETVSRFRNAGHDGLASIYTAYLAERGNPDCAGACIAMAGPVLDGIGRLTNRGWTFDRDELSAATGARRTAILNDLQAQGHAVGSLPAESFREIVPGPSGDDHSTRLVIGVGTGFNAVPVFATDTGRYVPPCEAGHATFPVLTDEDRSLARSVEGHHGFPGVEDVLSGRGLERVHAWASGDGAPASSAEIMAAIDRGEDPVAIRTAEAFCRALGRVAGDLSLIHLPFGGVYLVGGMANAMRPHLVRHGFTEAFRAKGRFSGFMEQFAVRMVDDDYAALIGCAHHIDRLLHL